MKTLDEVIDLFDNGCIRPCIECPCYGMKGCQEQLAAESYYLHKYQKIEEEHAENVPLTWDELKQMLGKPVWIEVKNLSIGTCPYWKDWYIIKSFSNDEFMYCNDGFEWVKEMQGRLWQAYRKEKDESNS